MSSTSVQDLYPLTNGGAILDAFFKDMAGGRGGNANKGGRGALAKSGGATGITSKVWSDLEMLNNSDNVAFFTVAFHHPSLHVVLPECLEVAARSIVSTSKIDRVAKSSIQALSEIVIRIITGFDVSAAADNNNANNNNKSSRSGRTNVDMISYCVRLQKLFPSSCWLSLAHVLYRQSPSATTIVMHSLFMHLPSDLPSFKAIAMTWCDQVGILNDKCVAEAKRGRFMRTNGDILVLFETAFRLSHEMWCLLEAAPLPISPFVPLDHVLDSLAELTNKISPLLQYFVLHSDDLQSSRKRLSRANALIVNAAIRSSTILTLFTPFIRGSAEESALSLGKGTGYANPNPVARLDESVTSQLLESLPASSLPCLLLKRCGSYAKAIKNIVPLMSTEDNNNSNNSASSGGKQRGANRRAGGTSASMAKRKITSDHNVTIFDAGSYRLGEVLADLIREASGGDDGDDDGPSSNKKKSSNNNGGSTRFVELLLIELVNQGCSITDWSQRELVDKYEASLLGGGSAPTSDAPSKRRGAGAGTDDNNDAGGIRKKAQYANDDDDADFKAAIAASAGGGGAAMDDEDAALAAAIAASRAEAGLADEPPTTASHSAAASASAAAQSQQQQTCSNPYVELVLSVLPDFSPKQAESALAYYNNNVEQLIMDATSDNLPPHLLAAAAAPSSAPSSSSAAVATAPASSSSAAAVSKPVAVVNMTTAAAAAAQSKKKGTAYGGAVGGDDGSYDDDDDDEPFPAHLDMFSFLNDIDNDHGGHSHGNNTTYTASSTGLGGGGGDGDDDDGGMGDIIYSSDMYFGGMSGLGAMDDDLRHRTLMLAQAQHERLYEDERDDGVDESDEANRYLASRIKADAAGDSDDEEDGNTGGGGMWGGGGDDNDGEESSFIPAFNNRNIPGPMRGDKFGHAGGAGGGGASSYQPKYTLKSTTFRVGGGGASGGGGADSRSPAGGGKDPRDKKNAKKKPAAGGGGGGASGGASSSAATGGGGKGGGGSANAKGHGPKGAKVNKSNITKLMKSGVLN